MASMFKNLLEQLEALKAENAELKKKLKTAPPKEATVRNKDTGCMAYSCGGFDNEGWLRVNYNQNDCGYADISFEDWEEIEVKIK